MISRPPFQSIARRYQGRLLPVLFTLLFPLAAIGVEPHEKLGYPMVTVGDPKNPDEDGFFFGLGSGLSIIDQENNGVGYVAEEFQIGQTEVTNELYVRFLNAVAADDRLYGLYSTKMGTDPDGGILRSGANGSYTYRLKDASFARKPVNFVSSFDAMRFINWLHNGMPGDPQAEDTSKRTPLSGAQGPDSTEDGAYTLVGKNPDDIVRRNPSARYFLPDIDEFHKAAYFDPNPGIDPATGFERPSQSYWRYADQTSTGRGGNFPTTGSASFQLADVGTSSNPSHYGTYDQDGNVAEWADSLITGAQRLIAGGSSTGALANDNEETGRKSYSQAEAELNRPLLEVSTLGFRLARPFELTVRPPAFEPVLVLVDGEGNKDDDRLRTSLSVLFPEENSVGAVAYTYQIGMYETTNEEYAIFLNSVAARSDPYGLYDARMAISRVRQGDGTYRYTPSDPEAPRKPVVYVNLFSAMRFCNWLHNGAELEGDTETGAYRLLGNLPEDTNKIKRSAGARYFIPTEDEWYKAAFYSKDRESYSLYATKKDVALRNEINFNFDPFDGNTGALLETGLLNTPSWFGTFDQSGNAEEWTESIYQRSPDGSRYTRGGSFSDYSGENATINRSVSSAGFDFVRPESKFSFGSQATGTLGFRVAAAPDVASGTPNFDTDEDGMPNGWELFYGFNPENPADAGQDFDSDGLSNLEEYLLRITYGASTSPIDRDSDRDGLPDGAEVKVHLTNPLRADTDGDGLSDKAEVEGTPATNPLKQDTDDDGLADNIEQKLGTRPDFTDSAPGDTYFTSVGDPGNDEDIFYDEDRSDAYRPGHVAEEFSMGKFEVTNFMYAEFLNAVARVSDPNKLYSDLMRLDPRGGITRERQGTGYRYAVKQGFAGKPVTFVSYWDALRYVNWLHNGRPDNGRQDSATTENGAYRLPVVPASAEGPVVRPSRSLAALYFLPDEDEWHKAAYYESGPGGIDPVRQPANSYWFFSDQKDDASGSNLTDQIVAVATVPGTPSNYGTYDQDGNVAEWIEFPGSATFPAKYSRGADRALSLTYPDTPEGDALLADVGFRVARAVAESVAQTPAVLPRMVSVGRPRNAGDPSVGNRGGVDYEFKIGAFEVTNAEYSAFLRAVAFADDPHGLYDPRMSSGLGGILRLETDDGFDYQPAPGRAQRPVNFVDLASAMRYCNWLHNGSGPGADTENGAYRLSNALKRNMSARYFLPSEDEWRKAAFHDPTARKTRFFWDYAMRTDRPRFEQIAGLSAVAGLQNVGVPGLRSFFGTYGQTGNAAEWIETFNEPTGKVMGGGLGFDWSDPIAAQYREEDSALRAPGVGFRIAAKISSHSSGIRKQVLVFRRLPKVRVGSADLALRGEASSELPVRYESSDVTVAMVSEDGARLIVQGPGRATITAFQDGDETWAPARPVSRVIRVLPAR